MIDVLRRSRRRGSRVFAYCGLVVALVAIGGCSTDPASNVKGTTATLNGTFQASEQVTSGWFEYGTTKSYGSATPSQSVNSNQTTNLTANVTGLKKYTTYHYRICGLNAKAQKGCAGDVAFTTKGDDIECGPANAPKGEALAIHGGGWIMGDASTALDVCQALAADGWHAVSLDYPLNDYNAATAYVRTAAQAAKAKGRTTVAIGQSAGASLAVGLAAKGLVDGAVGISGPYDFPTWPGGNTGSVPFLQVAGLGLCNATVTTGCDEQAAASPSGWIGSSSTRMLMMHARDDDVVPVSQSTKQIAKSSKVKYLTIPFPGGHSQPLANWSAASLQFLAQVGSDIPGAPDAPSDLAASVRGSDVALSWTASSSGDIAGYKVYRNGQLIGRPGADSAWTDRSAPSNAQLTYSVSAYDFDNLESPAADVVTDTVEAPAPVTELHASGGETSVQLSWTPSASDGITSYEVLDNDDDELLKTVDAGETSASIDNLPSSTQESFAVVSVAQDGARSAPVSVETATTAPQPTVDIVPKDGTTNFRMGWLLTFYLSFSVDMNHASAESGVTVTRKSDGAAVPGTWSWLGNMMSFAPAAAFAPATTYVIDVPQTVMTADGRQLIAAARSEFTTAP